MAKAINWPKEFLEEVLNEDSESLRIALRLGSLYYDNGYYTTDETVDIRVDHKVVRKAQIAGELSLSKIQDIPNAIFEMNKTSLKNKAKVISFLSQNYTQHVDDETIVTVITYKNLSYDRDERVDDPHC